MKHVLYFHGFGSSPESSKVKELSKYFKVFAPNVPYNYHGLPALSSEVEQYLVNEVFPGDEVVFVGTSLGGYFAVIVSHMFDGKCVVFNPATDPGFGLNKYLGVNTNFSTGEQFELTEEDVASFDGRGLTNEEAEGVTCVVSANDTVVDPTLAKALFHNVVVDYEEDHRFGNTEKMVGYINNKK